VDEGWRLVPGGGGGGWIGVDRGWGEGMEGMDGMVGDIGREGDLEASTGRKARCGMWEGASYGEGGNGFNM